MHVEGFFEWLGQVLGSVIRFIVDGIERVVQPAGQCRWQLHRWPGAHLGHGHFAGQHPALIIGLMLLYSAIRAFMRASIILGIIWLVLGLWVLSWVMH
jgi:hypothetical protein